MPFDHSRSRFQLQHGFVALPPLFAAESPSPSRPSRNGIGKFPILYAGSRAREGGDDVEPPRLRLHVRVNEDLDVSRSFDRCGDELAVIVDKDLDPSNCESTCT